MFVAVSFTKWRGSGAIWSRVLFHLGRILGTACVRKELPLRHWSDREGYNQWHWQWKEFVQCDSVVCMFCITHMTFCSQCWLCAGVGHWFIHLVHMDNLSQRCIYTNNAREQSGVVHFSAFKNYYYNYIYIYYQDNIHQVIHQLVGLFLHCLGTVHESWVEPASTFVNSILASQIIWHWQNGSAFR